MTAYLVNHTKKHKIFRQREEELRHTIRHEFSVEKIEKAAERLRQASQFSLEELATETPMVQPCVTMTTDEIVQEYS